MSLEPEPSALVGPPPRARHATRIRQGLAALALASSLAGWVSVVRRFDASASHHEHEIGAHQRAVVLQPVRLRDGASLRAVLCAPSGAAPRGARLVVHDRGDGRMGAPPLSIDPRMVDAHGGRCVEFVHHAPPTPVGEPLATSLVLEPDVRALRVDVYVSRRASIIDAWPLALLVAGLALLLVGRLLREALDEPVDAIDRNDAPRRPVLALMLYLANLPVVLLVQAAVSALVGPGPDGNRLRGPVFGVALLAQHLYLIGAAWWLLGKPWGRARLGFRPLEPASVVRSVLVGLGLVAVAVVATKLIPDASASPMGRLLEQVPIRYAVGWGALLAPLSEELFFRGALVHAFGGKSVRHGVLASTVVFTLAHAMQLSGAWAGLVPITAVALANGYLRMKSRALAEPWLVHTVYNGALSSALFFGG